MKRNIIRSKPADMSPMDAALSYLTARMRTVREVEERLDDLQYGEGDILTTVNRLQELNLLNYAEYAREFVRTRLASKPVSRQKLYMDLKAHKVPEELIRAALEELPTETEADNAREVAEKFWRQMSGLEESVRRERVLRRRMSRGVSTAASLAAIRQVAEAEE
ncbi:MAG: regulatory protein RecX [Clostridia bacterium]|nr:regulatory protein RecX [Clostridia bacterium]